jgi:hypothetical protein
MPCAHHWRAFCGASPWSCSCMPWAIATLIIVAEKSGSDEHRWSRARAEGPRSIAAHRSIHLKPARPPCHSGAHRQHELHFFFFASTFQASSELTTWMAFSSRLEGACMHCAPAPRGVSISASTSIGSVFLAR